MPAAVTSPVPAPDAVSRRKMASPGPNGNDNTNLLDAPFDDGLGGAVSPSVGQSVASFGRYNDVVSGQGSLLGTKRPRPHKIWRKKYIKVMVVGDSGLGKTTLIRTLLSTPGERLQVHDGSFTPRAQFARDPGSLCSTITWRDEEDKSIWVYRVQDTPGYGDDLDMQSNIDLIIRYVEAQNQKWLDMETSRRRVDDLQEAEDPRVDVCIFCIPPHRVRPVDLKYMADISQHVPVLPVITKADTMTIREAVAYRSEVAAKLANPQSVGLREKINVFRFDRDALERANVAESSSLPPFLVVASNDVNEELNALADSPVYWPERRYGWGTAEAFNPEHSDLLALRALLLKEALEDITRGKRLRYEEWRRRQLSRPRLGRKLFGLVLSVLPMAVCLHVGRMGLKVDDLKAMAITTAKTVAETAQLVHAEVSKRLPKKKAPAPVALPPPPPPKKGPFGW